MDKLLALAESWATKTGRVPVEYNEINPETGVFVSEDDNEQPLEDVYNDIGFTHYSPDDLVASFIKEMEVELDATGNDANAGSES